MSALAHPHTPGESRPPSTRFGVSPEAAELAACCGWCENQRPLIGELGTGEMRDWSGYVLGGTLGESVRGHGREADGPRRGSSTFEEWSTQRAGRTETRGRGGGLIAGSGTGRISWVRREGSQWASGRFEPESPWTCKTGEGRERRIAHRARAVPRAQRRRGGAVAGRRFMNGFRPRAAGLVGARCVGREARTAASSGKRAQRSMTTFGANSTWPICAVATRKRTDTGGKPRLSEHGFGLTP